MDPLVPATLAHLLVPLDGSPLAETALPAAAVLATRLRARVTLLHVLERRAPATVHGHRHLTAPAEAEAYLAGVAGRFGGTGWHVHPNPEGDVAASIAEHAAELGADLIVLCAHGQGGARGWLTGTLAQQVIRRVTPPVLLIRPEPGGSAAPFAPVSVVVALEGTPEGEAAIPAALAIARGVGAEVHFVQAVATLATVAGDRAASALLIPTATAAALDLEEAEAAAYLAGLAARTRPLGLTVRTGVVRGDAVRAVTELAGRDRRNVLALATHGRAGFDALWSGSVGSRVVAKAGGPLLLVHAGT